MRIQFTSPRSILAAVLCGAVFGIAPAAPAQKLAPTVGDPVPYRVSLPEGWATAHDDEMLYVVSEDEEFVIMVAAEDLVAGEDEPLAIPEPEARRIMTTMIMGSDSLLLDLLGQVFLNQNEYPVTELVQQIGTLGGERAAHLSARIRIDGEEGWFQFHATMRDGVIYMLGFMGKGDYTPERAPLIGRIHASFVLADAPQAADSRTGRAPALRPIDRSR